MGAIDLAVQRLETDEGFRAIAYQDTTGHLTIGYGFNVEAGISKYAAQALLEAQATEIEEALSQYAWYHGIDDTRASVFVELAFNLGLSGLLHFPHLLAAAGAGNWPEAHDQLLDSAAARQLPNRYQMLAQLLLNGA